MQAANRIAGLGYAVPGAVIAVGILVPVARLDNAIDAWMRAHFDVSTGLLLTGSIAALVYAYLVRFLTVALQTVEAGLTKITPSMDEAARSLGAGPVGTLVSVHGPLMRGSLLTAALLVFVDVMKELPATFVMRPFNFDTLAVHAYNLASRRAARRSVDVRAGDRRGEPGAADCIVAAHRPGGRHPRAGRRTHRRRARVTVQDDANPLFVADAVEYLLRVRLVLADRRDVERFGFERAHRFECRIVGRDVRHHRPFVVAVGEVILRFVAGEILEELDRGFLVRRVP